MFVVYGKEKITMTKENDYSSGGVGFVGLLTLLFIALKLIGPINWSWWWVLSPLWIPVGLGISVSIIVLILYAIFK